MALASSSSVSLSYIKEVTFGVTPVAGNSQAVRVTGESLDYAITKTASSEIKASRTITSMVPTDANVSGAVNFEMSYDGLDDLVESALQSAYVVYGTNGVGAAVATSGITATDITASAPTTGTELFTILQKGQWFRVTSAGANNGKILRVSTVTAPTSTVITLDVSTPATVSAGESIQIQSSRLTHGTTQTSFTIERHNNDIGKFMSFKGMTPSKLSLSIASGSLTTGSIDFMGKSGLESNTTLMPGTETAAPAYEIHSGVAGASNAVWLDGVPVAGTYVKSVSLSFDNTLRHQGAIGTLGSVAIGSGTIKCDMTAQIYFADNTILTQFRNNTNTSMILATTDADGNGYMISVPKANISTVKTNAGSKDQDMMLDVTMTALEDNANATVALRKLIFIDRFGAAVV